MTTRFYYIAGTFAAVGLIIIVWLVLFHERSAPTGSFEELAEYIEKHRPFISDFLGLSFPGQHAPMMGIDNVRGTPYVLTEEDQERAIKKLQDTFQNTQKISVAFYGCHLTEPRGIPIKEALMSYDQCLAAELYKQADLIQKTRIPPMNVSGTHPVIIFTLHPSGVKFNVMPRGGYFFSLKSSNPVFERCMRWEGDMHHLRMAFLDARLQDGETVRSVASRLPDGPYYGLPRSLNEHTSENDNAEEAD